MADELLDEVDPATGAVLRTMSRTVAHAEGRWHQVFHALVASPARGSVVLQRRAATKSAFPSLLDFSATGHLEAGETPLEGRRELEEELGVEVEPDALVPLGTRLLADDAGEGRNRELVHVFLAADDRALVDYRPPVDEVDGLVEIGVDTLLGVLADPGFRGTATEATTTGVSSIEVTRDDLVAGEEGYWVVLVTMASRFLAGERPLAV